MGKGRGEKGGYKRKERAEEEEVEGKSEGMETEKEVKQKMEGLGKQ